jgi:hypothetical protein
MTGASSSKSRGERALRKNGGNFDARAKHQLTESKSLRPRPRFLSPQNS